MSIEWYVAAVVAVACGGLLYSTVSLRLATERLCLAQRYYERSAEIWSAIDAVPGDGITEEALRKIEAFLGEETDQTGSIPSDYHKPA